VRRVGGGGGIGAGNDVDGRSSGAGEDKSRGDSGCDGGVEPGLMEKEKDASMERSSSTLRHSARRVNGIVPSTLHPVMFSSLVKAMSHDGLKHDMKCS
jgi:hypothetical protein